MTALDFCGTGVADFEYTPTADWNGDCAQGLGHICGMATRSAKQAYSPTGSG